MAIAKPNPRNLLPAISLAMAILTIDQMSKYLVVQHMNLRELGDIAVAPFVNFRMAWNTGFNFGLLGSDSTTARWILVGFTALLGLGVLCASMWMRHALPIAGMGIAAGGALGNMIDRVSYGAVADFLNVSCCGIENPWSFNVADIAIFAGFGLLFWPTNRKTVDVAG
jgi:signal peptidase II